MDGFVVEKKIAAYLASIEIPTENSADVAHSKLQEVASDVLLSRQLYEVDGFVTHNSVSTHCLS